jgi:hypothetical protein
MPTIAEAQNHFCPTQFEVTAWVKDGTTPRDYVNQVFGEGGDFDHPTVLTVNGAEVMREQWGKVELKGDDLAVFRRLPAVAAAAGWIVANGGLISLIAAPFLSQLFQPPDFKDRDESPSVFNLSGQKNLNKLGQVLQVPYGKNRIFPPYASSYYTKFENNDQYLFQLFCVGVGTYDITNFQINDTPTSSFEEITYEVYEEGDEVTLFPDNIITSDEVSSIELLAPDDDDYAGETGPFTANPANTDADVLEWDVVFPNGLYWVDSGGDFRTWQVDIDFKYREIDDAGDPVGAGTWTTVAFTKTLATNTPQRFTVSTSVTAGRYEVKAVRTSNSDPNPTLIDQVQWYQLRAQLPSTKDYGDVTLVAMKSKASNNLNSTSQNQFNVIATRKLPIWNGTTWSSPTATRSPVWAFCDVIRGAYGGNLPAAKLDLSSLLTLDAIYSSRNDTFNWVFDRKTTIYQALKTIATAGRAAPVVVGSKFSMVRDAPKTVPVAAFTPDQIKPNTFSLNQRFQPESDYDGITVSYMDEDTWTEETVDCLVGTDAGENTEKMVFPGITDRDKAYREGLYTRRKQIYQRETVNFDTGPEGRIPIYGDLCVASHDAPQWGQCGQVESIAGDLRTVTLADPIRVKTGDRIAFRDKYGAIDGPYACTVDSTDNYTVTTTTDIDGDFAFNANDEPPSYFFGSSTDLYKRLVLVEKSSSSEGDTESLSFVNYDEQIFDDDEATAPALVDAPIPSPPPLLPEVTNLLLTQDPSDSTKAIATWDAVEGAQYYLLQISYDSTAWSQVTATTTNYENNILVQQGTVYVRVAAVNAGQGPWTTSSTTIGLDVRITSGGDTRVTSDGDIRVSTQN